MKQNRVEKEIEILEKENEKLKDEIAFLKKEYTHIVNVYSEELEKINFTRFARLNYYYLKKHGLLKYLYQVFRTIGKLIKSLFYKITSRYRKNVYNIRLNRILKQSKYNKIFVFYPGYDWYMKMYQRPQHMAVHFSDKDILFFYCTVNWNDKIQGFKKIKNNLYVTDQFELLKKRLPKYTLYLYANENGCYINELNEILKKGNNLLYEYIDDLHEDLTNISQDLKARHEYVLKNKEIPVVTTAEYLYNKAKKIRGSEKNLLLSTNGVVYEDFHIIEELPVPDKMKEIVNEGKPIIGYYGALAKWFDYDLIEEIAEKHSDWNIVLIGIDYDKSFSEHQHFKHLKNVFYLGTVEYKELVNYGNCCDVLTIPFLINEITLSTSPVKVFEYMSMEKPIVTTDLPECRRYKSVQIAKNHEEFIELLEKNVKNKLTKKERDLLKKEALDNTWDSKVNEIIKFLKK